MSSLPATTVLHIIAENSTLSDGTKTLSVLSVKTRTTRDVKPAEAAVDHDKQRELRLVARDFLRQMPPSCQWRFDVLAVYYESHRPGSTFELFQNAFSVSYNH